MTNRLQKLIAGGRRVAPYVALELFMPGGTLLALLLWWHGRRRAPAEDRREAVLS